MTKDEALSTVRALKLALEALKYPLNQSHENFNVDMAELLAHRAITAIKEALMSDTDGAQPEQEPVAWVSSEELLVMRGNALGGAKDWRINVGLVKQDGDVGLYTTPPQRPSRSDIKPLSDEEIILIVADCASSHQHTDIHFARAIEAAHGIIAPTELKGEA